MNTMFLECESNYGFDETVEKLTTEIEKKPWHISAIHDFQQTLKMNGKEVLPVKVFDLCHPKFAAEILEKDDERVISSMMPCRVSVYQKSNGKTYLSRMNASAFAKSFGGVIEKVMINSSQEVEEMIRPVLLEKSVAHLINKSNLQHVKELDFECLVSWF
jgi:uncharacterized protein (DUF302 family)